MREIIYNLYCPFCEHKKCGVEEYPCNECIKEFNKQGKLSHQFFKTVSLKEDISGEVKNYERGKL